MQEHHHHEALLAELALLDDLIVAAGGHSAPLDVEDLDMLLGLRPRLPVPRRPDADVGAAATRPA